jgi:DNA segregation ATPase FtsK/SpoIIIE and related proteins
VYGSIISDFLLQSFGLIAFLLLATLVSWGLSLILKKELKKVVLKIFYIVLYLVFGCTFFYITYNNSYWLIDNGNSGFVGEIIYELIYKYFPLIGNQYSNFFLIFLTVIFFILASDINIKKILSNLLELIKVLFVRKRSESVTDSEIIKENTESNFIPEEKSQQSFTFDKREKISEIKTKNNFKLPSVDLLIKNTSKININDANKNRPSSEFMEKILFDFGINGKIKKINNGPVVSLYEFEPAPGIKVSKIINLSDDLARNTSSTSTRVSVIPRKNTVGIEIPNELPQ